MRYRYGPAALALAAEQAADTLYVVGGLYGNRPALDALLQLAAQEPGPVRLCFNGDFNWFNVDDRAFAEVNLRVLANDAILGNVEAELNAPQDDAGCGCAYPASVDANVVERSNRIHVQLKATARRRADLLARIARLPMVARYQVGDCRIGVVHGDAESLAGWRFDVKALDDPLQAPWLRSMFMASGVDVFASTHTCLPAVRTVATDGGRAGCVINNGAAGMPNFSGDLTGLCTRIGTTPSPHPALHELCVAGAYVALLPVHFDTLRWRDEFLAQWPAGSPAWQSYFERITRGPEFSPQQAIATLACIPANQDTQAPAVAGAWSEHEYSVGHQGTGL